MLVQDVEQREVCTVRAGSHHQPSFIESNAHVDGAAVIAGNDDEVVLADEDVRFVRSAGPPHRISVRARVPEKILDVDEVKSPKWCRCRMP